MKNLGISIIIVIAVWSISYAGSRETLAGKWNIEFLSGEYLAGEATGEFKVASFQYTLRESMKDIPSTYNFSCGFGANDKVTLVAHPLDMKTFWIRRVSQKEIYLIDTTNEDYKIRLTR